MKNVIIEKFRNIPKEIEIVCLGTTQAHFAFDFSECYLKGFNMALYKNPLQFNKYVLEKYKNHIKKNAIVLLTLEYPIFCISSVERIWNENVQQYAKILFGKNPYKSIFFQAWERLIPYKKNEQYYMLEYMSYLEKRNRYVNHFKPWELERMCKNLIKEGWEREIGIPDYIMSIHKKECIQIDKCMEETRECVIELINYCRQQEWIPVLVGLPYSSILNEYVPNTFKEKCFYRNVLYIQDHTGCIFLDYSMDKRVQNSNNYLDIWYLNQKERIKFTNVVIRESLDKIGKRSSLEAE